MEKLFWIDIQSSFIFGTQVRKVILLWFRLQNGRRPISNTLKIGRVIFSVSGSRISGLMDYQIWRVKLSLSIFLLKSIVRIV